MEPEIKLFRFEKSDGNFVELPEEKKQEEIRLEALKTKKERLEIRQKELDKRYKEAGERCRIAENNDILMICHRDHEDNIRHFDDMLKHTTKELN